MGLDFNRDGRSGSHVLMYMQIEYFKWMERTSGVIPS